MVTARLFEGFTVGRDRGIDLRLLLEEQNRFTIVGMCKHYARSGYAKPLSSVKSEAKKAAALHAQRYILITSVP